MHKGFTPTVKVELFGPGTTLVEQLMEEAGQIAASDYEAPVNPSLFCDIDTELAAMNAINACGRSGVLRPALLCVTGRLESDDYELHKAALHAVLAALLVDQLDEGQLFELKLPWIAALPA